ncbi:MAG: hypothetical protein ACYCOR_15450 [Acidobacteriaceae bacterium]
MKENRSSTHALVALLIVSLLVMIYVAITVPGFLGDQGTYAEWMKLTVRYGLRGAYENHSPLASINYPPIYVALLDVYAHVLLIFGKVQFSSLAGTFYAKLLPVFLLLTSISVALLLTLRNRVFNWKANLLPLLLLLFNPALILDGPAWGQTDVLFSALSVGSLLASPYRPFLSGVLFSLALLTKPQPGAIVPALGAILLFQASGHLATREWFSSALRRVGLFSAGVVSAAVPILGFFALDGRLWDMLRLSLFSAVGAYPFASMNAFNIWWWVLGVAPTTSDTMIVFPGITLRDLSLLLFVTAAIFIVLWIVRELRKKKSPTLIALEAGALCYFALFLLSTEMHERYELPVVFLLAVLVLLDKRRMGILILVTLASFFNMLFVMTSHFSETVSTLWVVYLNVMVAYLWVRSLVSENAGPREPEKSETRQER